MKNILLILFFINYCFSEEPKENNTNQEIINHDWKLNVFSLGYGMVPLGQFENNKPIKALTLMTMKYYWLNEYKRTRDNENVSDRNRSFWWLLFLNFYGIIDSYVDDHLKNFPNDDIKTDKKDSK